MSHLNNWKSTQGSQSLMSQDNARAPWGRKSESKEEEELPGDHRQPRGPTLQTAEDSQSTESKTKETGEGSAAEGGPSLGKTEPWKDAKDWKLPTPLGPVYPPLISSRAKATKPVEQTWELSPPLRKSFRIQDAHLARLPQRGSFWHLMDTKVEKRLATWKERRSRFGDVKVHKCYQFGHIFSPFQALATTEMRKLVFPRELPMSSHMKRMGASCLTDMNLQDLPLSSTKLDLGKDDNHHEKEKPVSHVKMPLFPPIVKATKYNDMK